MREGKQSEPYDYFGFLPLGIYQTLRQGEPTKVLKDSLYELSNQRLEFGKIVVTVICREKFESEGSYTERTSKIFLGISLNFLAEY